MASQRRTAALLTAAMLLGSLTGGSYGALRVQAAGTGSYPDLTDPAQIEAAEFLRTLGVINGLPDGTYHPKGTLTRGEFCKLAVTALGRGDEELAQRGRTIYLDVGPTHWARGYINLCSVITLGSGSDGKGGTSLVSGVGDGTFQPDRAVTYGEAVTILCRMLGYGVNDVAGGGAWYEGYLALAKGSGLSEGVSLSGTDTVDRGSAAQLFYNLYFTEIKGGKETYLAAQGGSEVKDKIILSVSATAEDGTTGAVATSQGTYKTDRIFSASLEGQKGTLLLDGDGKLLGFRSGKGSSKVVNVTGAEATYLLATGGEKLSIEPVTVVYREGKATTWESSYADLSTTGSTAVTLYYKANGELDYLFLSGKASTGSTSMVLRSKPNGTTNYFAALAESSSYTMYKNGLPATAGDLRQYDVATYDGSTRTIQVSDLKLTGVYEGASPSPNAPTSIIVLGHTFPVLASARVDIAAFKVGEKLTLLLTADGSVAGVVSPQTASGNAVGVASISEGTATVKLLQGGITVSGKLSSSQTEKYKDQLVKVTSSSAGKLSLQLVTGTQASGTLDTVGRKLGERTVVENVEIYDRVSNGPLQRVTLDQLPAKVSAAQISFVSYDYAGRVKYIVLKDVTGDCYAYGYFGYQTEEIDSSFNGSTDTYTKRTVWIRQSNASGVEQKVCTTSTVDTFRNGSLGGLALTADGRVAASVSLTALKGVERAAFDLDAMTVTVAGTAYPISDAVQCYNKTTKTWFQPGLEGLKQARAYADTLTIYYDRPAGEGGKIRFVEVG